MNKSNVETIIKDLFTENYSAYPESYPINEDGTATNEASECVQELAIGYFENRQESEIERDEELGITKIDYVEWCMEKFSSLIPQLD